MEHDGRRYACYRQNCLNIMSSLISCIQISQNDLIGDVGHVGLQSNDLFCHLDVKSMNLIVKHMHSVESINSICINVDIFYILRLDLKKTMTFFFFRRNCPRSSD